MFGFILQKIIGTQNERFLNKITPIVERINSFENDISSLSEEALRAKTDEFKKRLSQGETLDDILPEAFAVVREAAKRTIGMRHFDVQLIGGVVLHKGMIAEMTTGEGKTLVATLPAYLNALGGKGVHIITVNDYLARRDREWMGPIFEFLGLTIGVVQHDMRREDRQIAYGSDITYGTNNEFGFDYLRDNMVIRPEDIVQRPLNYAIVDEVDSILVDEARTPLIISGMVERSNEAFTSLKAPVENIVRSQRRIINSILDEATARYKESEENQDAIFKLLQVETGDPKNPRFLNFISRNPSVKKQINRLAGELAINKETMKLREGLFYANNEKEKNVELTDLGIQQLEKNIGDIFTIEEAFLKKMEDVSKKGEDKARGIQETDGELYDEGYLEKSEKQHVVLQLLKAYVLFQKDTDYVVQPSGEVVIVDEFTGRLMPGRRWSDGLHQAVEAKEGVKIERASQTLATITFQNYFRMYDKLSGMTGTAATEAAEFNHIYKLEVVVIPTNKPLMRSNLNDVIYKTEKEKYTAVCDEIEELYQKGRPVLVGTVSIEKSERLGKMLARRNVPHQVLNAKYHEREAHIIAQSGRFQGVTIATNMAGRGTDILLGGNPEYLAGDIIDKKLEEGYEVNDDEKKKIYARTKTQTEDEHRKVVELGGLHVIGTERHEARRIDNQLRGRAGRQGDPGSSRFYLSLEDDLMRIFGSDRIAMIMEKLGIEEGQEIQHPLVTKAISTAQGRVESYNFEIRKHLLDYDNVMNKQREVIYARRRQILMKDHLKEYVQEIMETTIDRGLDRFLIPELRQEDWDYKGLVNWLKFEFGLVLGSLSLSEISKIKKGETKINFDELQEDIKNKVLELYEFKNRSLGDEKMRELERFVLLQIIEEEWKDHLYALDSLREGIGLRAIGQRDPLVEYKNEAFDLFVNMIDRIEERSIQMIFRVRTVAEETPAAVFEQTPVEFVHPEVASFKSGGARTAADIPSAAGDEDKQPDSYKRPSKKIGRNEPCPCGSGKKYKKCCGQ